MLVRECIIPDIPQMHVIRLAVKENRLSNPLRVTEKDYEDFISIYGKGWVCEINNHIVGFAIVDVANHNIWALFVHPDYEKQGVGFLLHKTMLNWYFNQTSQTVWLGTSASTRAESFYRKMGWGEITSDIEDELKFEMSAQTWKDSPLSQLK